MTSAARNHVHTPSSLLHCLLLLLLLSSHNPCSPLHPHIVLVQKCGHEGNPHPHFTVLLSTKLDHNATAMFGRETEKSPLED